MDLRGFGGLLYFHVRHFGIFEFSISVPRIPHPTYFEAIPVLPDWQLSATQLLVLQVAGWVVGLTVLMSFIEHQLHRRVMHRKGFFSSRIAALKTAFEQHAIVHHGHYLKTFHDAPVPSGTDRGIQLSMREGFFESLPFSLVIALFSYTGAIIFPLIACTHHFIWNKIHMEMHKPEDRFFTRWSVYKFLARHHYLHHRYPNKNFNVVFPLADYVLGTNARANEADLAGMRAEGLL